MLKKLEAPAPGKGPARTSRDHAAPGKTTRTQQAAAQFAQVRPSMERAFGEDFSDVNVSESSDAADKGALAYARGSDIVFAPGVADAKSEEGRALFGHELVHVVQARANRASGERQKGAAAGDAALEAEADDLGAKAARGERVHVERGAAAGGQERILRKTDEATSAAEPSAADIAAAEAVAVEQEAEAQMKADASSVVSSLRKLDVDLALKIPAAAAAKLIAKFTTWSRAGRLDEFVKKVRGKSMDGAIASLLTADNAWSYFLAVISKSSRLKIYALLADENLDARNAGRFTEDIIEFWDIQMRGDVATIKSAYRRLAAAGDSASKAGVRASAGAEILTTLAEYVALDGKYTMRGTLVSKFLTKCDKVVEIDAFLGTGLITQQTRMLEDIKRCLPTGMVGAYIGLLNRSNHEDLKGPAPEVMSVAGEALATAAEAIESVSDLIDYVAKVAPELAEKAVRLLAKTASKVDIVIGFVADHFSVQKKLVGIILSCLNPKNIVKALMRIDPARLGEFYAAMVVLAGSAMFLPQLFAAYYLLPDETRKKVFSALGRTAFRPLIREAKAHLVPVLQDLLDSELAVGEGVYFERGLSASARVAQAGGDSRFSVIRTSKGVIQYDERFALRGGVGVGGGIGMTEGKSKSKSKGAQGGKGGKGGDSEYFWGHELSANAAAVAQLVTQNRYEFPLFDDDAFIGFLAALVDIEAAVSVGAFAFDELKAIDPMPYLTKSKIEPSLEATAGAAASSGLKSGKRDGQGDSDKPIHWDDAEKSEAMGSSVGGMFGAQVGATITQMCSIGAALEIEKVGEKHEVSLELGARRAQTVGINIPGLGLLSKAVPLNLDNGAAIKLKTTIKGLSQREPTMVGGWKLAIVASSGDIDTYSGPASETEAEISMDDSIDSVDSFIAALGDATYKRRIGLASGIGSKMLKSLENQTTLTSQLKKNYKYGGIKIKGFVDLEFKVKGSDTRRIARSISALVAKAATSEDLLSEVKDAATTFLTTGKLPKGLADLGSLVTEILGSSLEKAEYHIEAGAAVAFGTEMFGDKNDGGKASSGKASGGKSSGKGGIGGQGYLGTGKIHHGPMINAVRFLEESELLEAIEGSEKVLGTLETVFDLK